MWTNWLPTQEEIYQLEKELQEKKRKLAEQTRKQKMEKEKEFIETTKVDVRRSDDYYGSSSGEYSFYFWYEKTMCKKHPKSKDCEDRFECDEREWCFVASKWNKEIMRLPASSLKDWNIDETFVSWLMMFIQQITN